MPLDAIITLVRKQFLIEWDGIHGAAHMARVRENGLRIAEASGAIPEVVELFAYLHDARRENNAIDPGHGRRGADLARSLRGSLITLPDRAFELLAFACERHTDGLTEADPTVQTCWDADRLDLGRIGRRPDPAFLGTDAARSEALIAWAFERSRR